MTFTDMVSAIQQIQSQLATLSAAPAGSADGGAAFADALSGASSASGTSGTTVASTTASTDGSLIEANGVTGEDVVKDAEKYLGVPYVFGGESSKGMDCSGLVQKTFADLGISVPRLVHEQQTVGQKVDSLKDAKPGDLIVLNGGDHIAIYAGNGMVVHAPYEGRTVSLQKAWFSDSDIVTIRRIVPATGTPTSASSGTDVAALEAMYAGSSSSGSDTSLSGLMSSLGASGSSSTAQQLLAARAALSGVAG